MTIRGGNPDEVPLTIEEKAAIRSLKALAKRWPRSLWLYSAGGSLNVMRKTDDGLVFDNPRRGIDREGQDYIVDTIQGIDNDGGDW